MYVFFCPPLIHPPSANLLHAHRYVSDAEGCFFLYRLYQHVSVCLSLLITLKGVEGSGCVHSFGETEEYHENPQDGRSSRLWNRAHLEYKSEVSPFEPFYTVTSQVSFYYKGKGKGHPITCHMTHREGVEAWFCPFLTTALDWVGQCHSLAALPPKKIPGTHYRGIRWALGSV